MKSITGEEGPVNSFSSVCVGVEGEERKLRQKERNRMVSGLGATASFSHQGRIELGYVPC